ncbi:endonuclease [Bacteroidia bacterium]|nr:endonuclease [Bacteroidia bacterium]
MKDEGIAGQARNDKQKQGASDHDKQRQGRASNREKRKPRKQQPNRVLAFLRETMTVVAIVSLLALILAAFSDRISPLVTVLPAYFGLFFPFILAWNVLIWILWLCFRKWLQAGITLLVFLICWGAVSSYFQMHSLTKNVPADCIKVMTYNVMSFDHLKKHSLTQPNEMLQYVQKQDPDIVCFQEIAFSIYSSRMTKEDVLRALKKLPYYYIDAYHSNAVFSKFPIISTQEIPIESEVANGAFIAELNVNGKRVMLVNNHLESNKITEHERTSFHDMTTDPNTHKVKRFFQRILFNRMTPAFKWRARQANLISKKIAESTSPYTIVCGDFNDTPISYTRHKMKGDLVDSFVESGSGMGITFNKYRFLFRIDYILHSANIKSYNTTVGKLRSSDHYPLTTCLQLK